MKAHYLYPGKLVAFSEETQISTLLGSCVAVAIHDPQARVGGLNHYLLPDNIPGEVPSPRYGEFAIPELIRQVEALGGSRKRMVAKLYGGANVLTMASSMSGSMAIGQRNIDIAEKLLAKEGIKIIHKEVGGEKARTIMVNSATLDVLLNRGRENENTEENKSSSGHVSAIDVSGFAALRAAKSVKVLIVDDSATVRTLFTNIFTKGGLEVVGAAADAYQARELIASKKPDVLTLDIEMPRMSGVMFLEKLMKHQPMPVVMVSSLGESGDAALRSLELGAVEFVHKPSQYDPAVLRDLAQMLIEKVRAAASVNIIKKMKEANPIVSAAAVQQVDEIRKKSSELKVVVLGGNSGSPEAIEKFVTGLAQDTPPVVIACSTISSFLPAYIDKLKGRCKVSLQIGKDNDWLKMGSVYFVPGNIHGHVESLSGQPILKLREGKPVAFQLPSANILFESAAKSFGAGVYAILLGGFGSDGVEGLQKINAMGGATVVQHPTEAQFPFGPQKAIELGIADQILKSENLAKCLMDYRNKSVF